MFYLWDSNGDAWECKAGIEGQPATQKIGPLPLGTITVLNPADGSIANSWRIDISTNGVLSTVALAYSASYPLVISPNGAFDWSLTVLATGALQWVWGYGLGLPKIVYPSTVLGGAATTLYFRYPARLVPGHILEAIRHVNRASSGVQEILLERIDEFWEGALEYVVSPSELAAWKAFMVAALGGLPFDYYPDSSEGDHTAYYLDDNNWQPDYQGPQRYRFKLRFYKYVAWP